MVGNNPFLFSIRSWGLSWNQVVSSEKSLFPRKSNSGPQRPIFFHLLHWWIHFTLDLELVQCYEKTLENGFSMWNSESFYFRTFPLELRKTARAELFLIEPSLLSPSLGAPCFQAMVSMSFKEGVLLSLSVWISSLWGCRKRTNRIIRREVPPCGQMTTYQQPAVCLLHCKGSHGMWLWMPTNPDHMEEHSSARCTQVRVLPRSGLTMKMSFIFP